MQVGLGQPQAMTTARQAERLARELGNEHARAVALGVILSKPTDRSRRPEGGAACSARRPCQSIGPFGSRTAQSDHPQQPGHLVCPYRRSGASRHAIRGVARARACERLRLRRAQGPWKSGSGLQEPRGVGSRARYLRPDVADLPGVRTRRKDRRGFSTTWGTSSISSAAIGTLSSSIRRRWRCRAGWWQGKRSAIAQHDRPDVLRTRRVHESARVQPRITRDPPSDRRPARAGRFIGQRGPRLAPAGRARQGARRAQRSADDSPEHPRADRRNGHTP